MDYQPLWSATNIGRPLTMLENQRLNVWACERGFTSPRCQALWQLLIGRGNGFRNPMLAKKAMFDQIHICLYRHLHKAPPVTKSSLEPLRSWKTWSIWGTVKLLKEMDYYSHLGLGPPAPPITKPEQQTHHYICKEHKGGLSQNSLCASFVTHGAHTSRW